MNDKYEIDIPAVKWVLLFLSDSLPFLFLTFFHSLLMLSSASFLSLFFLSIFLPSFRSLFLGGGSLSVFQRRRRLLMWHRVKGHVKGDQSRSCGTARDNKAFNKPNHRGASLFWSFRAFGIEQTHTIVSAPPWTCCNMTDGEGTTKIKSPSKGSSPSDFWMFS